MSQFISLETAEAMTQAYRNNYENILKTEYQNQDVLPLSETFDRSSLEALIDKTECQGLRIYYGMTEDLKVHAILVAVNSNNEDMLPSGEGLTGDDEVIVDNGNRCPELCPPSSPLNT